MGATFIEDATTGEVVAVTAKEVAVPVEDCPGCPGYKGITVQLPISCWEVLRSNLGSYYSQAWSPIHLVGSSTCHSLNYPISHA